MKVLKAIGNFFVKIWKWITKTAWIQPLLIVGILFGVIFSIPPIINAINTTSSKNELVFLHDENVSFEGISKKGGNSDVEKLVKAIKTASDESKAIVGYEQKFFLTFSQEACSGCADLSKSMKTLKDNWNKSAEYTPAVAGEKLKFYNIQADTVLKDAEDEDLYPDVNPTFQAFYTLLVNGSGLDTLFNTASEVATERDFFFNLGDKTSYENKLENMDSAAGSTQSVGDFETPTVILFDFSEAGLEYSGGTGIREVFFGVQNAYSSGGGTALRGQAKFLIDAWNGTGDFSDNRK